jgi:hypothetical protein
MNFEIAVVGIGLARQQSLELAALDLALEIAKRRFGLSDNLRVILGLAQLDHGQLIVDVAADAFKRRELIVERVALAHQFLRTRRIVPEGGIFRFQIQLGKAAPGLIDVKDASSAIRAIA